MPVEGIEIPESGYDAVIFDCDGTLVDSMPLHYDAWVHALKKAGLIGLSVSSTGWSAGPARRFGLAL